MTVESNYVIAIATPSDWLTRVAPVFNQWEAKPKPIAPCTRDFSRASLELQVIARNFDWFIALFVPVVIGRSDCFGFGFSTVIWKLVYQRLFLEYKGYITAIFKCCILLLFSRLCDPNKKMLEENAVLTLTLKIEEDRTPLSHKEGRKATTNFPFVFSLYDSLK